MSRITILGLGPGAPGALTLEAFQLLSQLDHVFVRTQIHPTIAALPQHLTLHSFDHVYDQADDFALVYRTIAQTLLDQAAQGNPVVYAVPGHPLIAEASSRFVLQQAAQAQIEVQIVHGLSFIEPVCTALQQDPLAPGMLLLDALDLLPAAVPHAADADRAWCELHNVAAYQPPPPLPLTPVQPLLLCQVYNQAVAADVKLSLLERYPADHSVTLVYHAGLPDQQVLAVALHELDHQQFFDHLTCVFVPALAQLEDLRGFETLVSIMERLTGPYGCPWDRKQDHATLRRFMLEEMYEALDAVDAEDWDAVAEELGDLLLQIVFHAEFGRQAGRFTMGDILEAINAKMIRRHPHIFGDVVAPEAADVLRNWEAIKATEKAEKGQQSPEGMLANLPSALPSLSLAQLTGTKVAKVGFDWPAVAGVWEKVYEELTELQQAPAEQQAGELGDLLFALTNLARWLNIDAEHALRQTIHKFRRRFEYVEQSAAAEGKSVAELSLDEADQLWETAKRLEQQPSQHP